MKKRRIAGLLVLSLLTGLLFLGCARGKLARSRVSNGGKLFAVTADSTPFYRYGPQQASGPDQTLKKDTLLTLIRPSFGYAKVKLSSGEEGFVANDDIRVASSDLIAAADTSAAPSTTAPQFQFRPPDPRLMGPPESLPEFEPTPIPVPPDFAN